MPLTPLGPGVHFFPSAVNSVVVEDSHGGALLVDTGLDESHARKLLRALEETGLTPVAILNTHSHADHHGGNAFILKRFPELPVYAPPVESAIINDPMLEPLYLFGACPPPELRTRFLLAPPSPAQPIRSGVQRLGGVTVELIDVPGHAVQMYAVRVGELLYAADALNGPDNLHKHPLIFCVDSVQQKASARKLGELDGIRVVLPGHGEPAADLRALAEVNVEKYGQTTRNVLEAVRQGEATIDELLARVCNDLNIQMSNAPSVVLNRSVISAHLVELQQAGQVTQAVKDNRLLFQAT
ncbi:MBL fold metallo-hydrolase [Deinococcus antarcticus]|uniref:MBL fold metallo-hydrolase n=1 Tax=Deinococcus antarcticus TaxID=1298767 RepID=A0ABV8A4E5_9DEIO